jgi:ABC-type antimicrobial peptide transport system permease subunit
MFFTYLGRELRRRLRQAILIALGLALGIGLVITVEAASSGVNSSQTAVLHSLYGVGTDITVTQPPKPGQARSTALQFKQQFQAVQHGGASLSGQTVHLDNLINEQYGTMSTADLAKVARQPHVTGAVGGLTLLNADVTVTIPSVDIGKGGGSSSLNSDVSTSSSTVEGVDTSHLGTGPVSGDSVTSGSRFTAASANSDDAILDSGYAKQQKLKVGNTVQIGDQQFKVIGIVSAPQGGSPPNVYIPLAKAQSIGKTGSASLKNEINTMYVTVASATDIPAAQSSIAKALPGATITDQNDLASEVTGSLSSASTLANELGKWLSVAVLIAAFLVASLLTMSAVSRRVREFGTLKALGWRSRRIVGQVMGESVVTGIAGGVIGVGIGFAAAGIINKVAPKLTATVGPTGTQPTAGAGGGGGALSQAASAIAGHTAHTVAVPLTATVTIGTILLAVVIAVVGGLIAGTFGGWRAARLRPAAALARVE